MQYRNGFFQKSTQNNQIKYNVKVLEDNENTNLNKIYTPTPCVNCKKHKINKKDIV